MAVRRATFAILLLTLLVAASSASTPTPPAAAVSPVFGASGIPHFDAYPAPEGLANAHGAGEPTIGIPWNTDHAFFQAFSTTYRIVFDDAKIEDGKPAAAWTDVSPVFTVTNVDPMLVADHVSGRVWAGGLAGPCSLMGMTDDDGETWLPAGNMCSGPQFDHQSLGSGRWSTSAPESIARELVYPRATYYCAQLQVLSPGPGTACATSLNGGLVWLPPTEVIGGCGGLHGHIRVSEVSGTAAYPDQSCNENGEGGNPIFPNGPDRVGFAYTSDNGLTWNSRTIPESEPGDGGGFDPNLDWTEESGWLYFTLADEQGLHVAMSKDEGRTWEQLGGLTPGTQPAIWLDLSDVYHDEDGNGIKYATFGNVIAGDDLRAAIAFMGTTDPKALHPFDDCSEASDENVWHYYLAQTFDGGQLWTVTRLSEDPIQIGAIWDGGGGDPCRNLLDFNDMDLDSNGRLHISFADGCTSQCAEAWADHVTKGKEAPVGSDSRDSLATVLRQTTGRGVYAASDVADPVVEPTPATPTEPTKESPGVGLVLVAAGLVAVAFAGRRRQA